MHGSAFRLLIVCLIVALNLTACQREPATAQNALEPANATASPADDIPLGQLPADVRPVSYQLEITINPQLDDFNGTILIDLDITGSHDHFYLHGKNIEASSVRLSDGVNTFSATYAQVDPSGIVRISSPQPLEGRIQLEITYSAPFNQALEGLYKVSESGNDYAFTQFEAISARLAFPCFDEPGFKTPFTTTLIVPESQVAISNTPELSSEIIDGMKVVHFAPTEPLPTYLVAFAVGDFDVVECAGPAGDRMRDHPLPLRGIAVKGKGEQLAYALENTNAIVTALESYFGTPYPWAKLDILAVPDFSAGAMENAGHHLS